MPRVQLLLDGGQPQDVGVDGRGGDGFCDPDPDFVSETELGKVNGEAVFDGFTQVIADGGRFEAADGGDLGDVALGLEEEV